MAALISLIATIVYFALVLYFLTLWARFVVDLVRIFRRNWRPRGIGLVLADAMYTITDPPIRFFRRILPPLSVGSVALDFGWSLTMLSVLVLMTLVSIAR